MSPHRRLVLAGTLLAAMANKRKSKEEEGQKPGLGWPAVFVLMTDAFNRTREKIGLLGALILGYLALLQGWGTADDRKEFVHKVLLLHALDNAGPILPLLITLAFSLVVIWTVAKYYKKMIKVKDRRIKSLEKSIEEYRRQYPGVPIVRKLEELEEE